LYDVPLAVGLLVIAVSVNVGLATEELGSPPPI